MRRVLLARMRRKGWVLMVVAGIGLIVSDRLAARQVGNRPWIVRTEARSYVDPDATSDQPAAQTRVEDIVLPVVRFQFTAQGSFLRDIKAWLWREARVDLDVNWRALERVGVARDVTIGYDGTRVPLRKLMDALALRIGAWNGVKLAWAAEPGRVVYLTTADDLAAEGRWRAQRLTGAGPRLRSLLDRRLDYAKLRLLSVVEVVGHCARVAGVRIEFEADVDTGDGTLAEPVDVLTADVTFERMLELALRRTRGHRASLRLRADGDRLVVFQPAEGE